MLIPDKISNTTTTVNQFLTVLFSPATLKANPECALHYFIANDKDPLIAPTLEKWKTSHSITQINQQVTDFLLSPLHVAVLKGKLEAAKILIANGASLSVQDIHGCTPLHLAVMLQNEEMLEVLKKKAAKSDRAALEIRNSNYDTFQNIKESLQNPSQIAPGKIVSYYAKEQNSIVPLTAEAFKTLTKTAYCSTLIASQEILFKRWQRLPKKVKAIPLDRQKALDAYFTKPPKLILSEEVAANGSFSIGLGVKAGESIEKGQILQEFAGELDVDLKSRYALGTKKGSIEPFRYGNEASRVNDGFPNCTWVSAGIKKYFIALNRIENGQWLYTNYGIGHYTTKFGRYAVCDMKVIESFAKNLTIQFVEIAKESGKQGAAPYLRAKLIYIFHTPYVMTYLLLKEKINIGLVEFILSDDTILAMAGLDKSDSNNAKVAINHYKDLISLIKYLHRQPNRALYLEVVAYFLELLEKQPVIVVIQHLRILSSNKERLFTTRAQWEEHKNLIEKSVAIQSETVAAAQGITHPDQIPQETKERLWNIFNKNAGWILRNDNLNLINESLAFGVSNDAQKAVTGLLNRFKQKVSQVLTARQHQADAIKP